MAEAFKITPPASAANDATASPARDTSDSAGRFTRSLRNVVWMSSGSVLTRVLNLSRGIVLARLLTPFDFGVYGLAGSIVGVKERFADIGAGSFLIYRPKDFAEHTETTFWVNLALSSLLLTALALAAPPLAKFYREPLLAPVLILLALGVWARLNASIHQSLLRTQGRFRALALIDNCSSLAWLATAIALAWFGFGVWALVVSAVSANVVLAILWILTGGWKPRWRVSKGSLYLLGGFSFWYLGQGLLWYLVGNMDNFLVGRYLGMSLLGIYALAYNYALLPVTTIGNSMGSVGFAELPKLRDQPEAFWPAYLDFSRVLALGGSLVAFAGAVAAPDLIPQVFGMKWAPAVVPFQILSVYAAARCLWMDPFGATGEFRTSSLIGLGSVIAAFVLVGLGLRYGLAGVAVAMLLTQLGSSLFSLRWMSQSWSRVWQVARATTPYLAGGIVMALVALGVRAEMVDKKMPPGIWTAAVTLGVFLGGYGLLFRRDLARMQRQLCHRRMAGDLSETREPSLAIPAQSALRTTEAAAVLNPSYSAWAGGPPPTRATEPMAVLGRPPAESPDSDADAPLTESGRNRGAPSEEMTISVCIPTCRRPELLREALLSCFDQTRPPDEILVGDDAPGHGALELVNEMQSRLAGRIRYFANSPSLGQAGNVSQLYQHAASSHSLLLHDDDLLLPNALEDLSSSWRRCPGLSAAFGMQAVMPGSDTVDWEASARLNASFLRTPNRAGIQRPSWFSGVAQQFPNDGFLVRTSAAREVVCDEKPTDAVDYVFAVKFCTRFDGIYFLDRYTMVYRVTPLSVTASWKCNAALSSYHFLERVPLPAEAEALRRRKLEDFAPLAVGEAVRLGNRREAMRIYSGPFYPLRSRLRPRDLARIAQLALPLRVLRTSRASRRTPGGDSA